MPTIGLIGLGNAGRHIGERILARGYALTVYDLNASTVEGMVQRGARRAAFAKEAVADITLTVLPSSIEVRQAVFGEAGAFVAIQPGMTFIDLSGTDPDCARQLQSRLEEKQAAFLGGTIHASGAPAIVIPQGQFTIAVGGKREIIDGIIGFLSELAQTIICLPEPWMPKAFKIAVIMYSTANNIATAEICSWLTTQGADPKLFLKLLRTTGSQASAVRLEEFMQRNNNNGGALSNSYKDIRQALEVAAALQIPMPLLSMANQIQEMGRASGFTRLNSPAAMGKLYELITGADLSGATMRVDKKLPGSRESRVVYLGD
jgi:3-hydroxyisobutyrate dehydrogenase-like beta-hydroxyacid dehydrogenase